MSNKVIAFAGADRRTGATTLAYSFFRRIARNNPNKQAVYLDLSEDSGIAEYLGSEYTNDIDDLMVLATSNRLQCSDIKACAVELDRNSWYVPGTTLSYEHSIAKRCDDVSKIIERASEVFDYTILEVGTSICDEVGEKLKDMNIPIVIVLEQEFRLLEKVVELVDSLSEDNRIIAINKFRDGVQFKSKDVDKRFKSRAIIEVGLDDGLTNNILVGKFRDEVEKNEQLNRANDVLMETLGIENNQEERGFFSRFIGGRKK